MFAQTNLVKLHLRHRVDQSRERLDGTLSPNDLPCFDRAAQSRGSPTSYKTGQTHNQEPGLMTCRAEELQEAPEYTQIQRSRIGGSILRR